MTENRFASETLFFNKPAFSLFSLPPLLSPSLLPRIRNVVLSARLIYISLSFFFSFSSLFYFILFFVLNFRRSIRSAFIKRENVNAEKRVWIVRMLRVDLLMRCYFSTGKGLLFFFFFFFFTIVEGGEKKERNEIYIYISLSKDFVCKLLPLCNGSKLKDKNWWFLFFFQFEIEAIQKLLIVSKNCSSSDLYSKHRVLCRFISE